MSILRMHLTTDAARAYAAELVRQADLIDAANKERGCDTSYVWLHADDSEKQPFAIRVSNNLGGDADQFSL